MAKKKAVASTTNGKAVRKPRKDSAPALPVEPGHLTWKQRLFVVAYLGEANGNGTEAARIAGYACPKEQAVENLAKPLIQAAVSAKMDSASLSASEILTRLSDVASADVSPFLRFDRYGKPSIDVKAMRDAGMAHLIKAIRPTKAGIVVELHDSQAALERLGRYRKLWVDRVEMAGPDGGPIPVEIEQVVEKVYGDDCSGEPDGG